MKIQNKHFSSFSALLSVWITSVIAMVSGADPAGMTVFSMCCTIGFMIGCGIRQAKNQREEGQ